MTLEMLYQYLVQQHFEHFRFELAKYSAHHLMCQFETEQLQSLQPAK